MLQPLGLLYFHAENNTRSRRSPRPSDFAPALDDVAPEQFSAMAHPVNSATQHFGHFWREADRTEPRLQSV